MLPLLSCLWKQGLFLFRHHELFINNIFHVEEVLPLAHHFKELLNLKNEEISNPVVIPRKAESHEAAINMGFSFNSLL